MVPIEIFGLLGVLALVFFVWGYSSKKQWVRLFGSLLLIITGIVVLSSGGISYNEKPIAFDGVNITYATEGVSTSETWLFGSAVTIMLIGFVSMFVGVNFSKSYDPFFS